jgi:hypothetical protein
MKYAKTGFKFAQKNIATINFVLISLVIVYLALKTNKLVEGFDNNTIDFESLHNLSAIATKLNSGKAFEFPGDLTIAGKLTVNSDISLRNTSVARGVVGCILTDSSGGAPSSVSGEYNIRDHSMIDSLVWGNYKDMNDEANGGTIMPGFKVKVFKGNNFDGASNEYSGGKTGKQVDFTPYNIGSIKIRYENESFDSLTLP